MGIYENITNNRYRNNKTLCRSATDKEERKRLKELFYQDLCEDSGVEDNNTSRKVFDKAWEDGHSSGYYEIYTNWLDLWDFLDSL